MQKKKAPQPGVDRVQANATGGGGAGHEPRGHCAAALPEGERFKLNGAIWVARPFSRAPVEGLVFKWKPKKNQFFLRGVPSEEDKPILL